MRKLLNTLYITTPNSYISKDGLNVVISIEGSEVFRIPAINIEGIVTFGYMGVSPGLMRLCVENGISISFLSPSGKFVSRVVGPKMGNVLLRKNNVNSPTTINLLFTCANYSLWGKSKTTEASCSGI